jgi:hypothetical protein|tara:strand:- start:5086 stop:5355 length:270 start_codon:yes stop_codon:yes gene_type:complete
MPIEFVLLGILGGFVRALYGLLKAVNQGIMINKGYFFTSLIISGFIGGLLGYMIDIDFRVAAMAGYVGTDILENVFVGALPSTITLRKK